MRTADEYRRLGRLSEAIALCVRELETRPTYASARVVLGRAYLENGEFAKAEEEFGRAVQTSPENLRARLFLAQVCEAQGRTDDAIGHYRAALFLAPFDRTLRARLAELENPDARPSPRPPLSQPEDRREDWSTPPGWDPGEESPFATETLADLYASQGVADRAAAIYQSLLEQDPSRSEIRSKLTAVLQHRGEFEHIEDGTSTWREGDPSLARRADLREGTDAAGANPEVVQGEADPGRERP